MLNGSVFTAQESFIALVMLRAVRRCNGRCSISSFRKSQRHFFANFRPPIPTAFLSGQLCRPSCRTVEILEQPGTCDNIKTQKLRLLARHSTS